MVLPEAVHVEAHFFGQDDLIDHLAQTLGVTDGLA